MAGYQAPYPPCLTDTCESRECCASVYGGGNKSVWPEVVGLDAQIATAIIQREYKVVKVQIVPPGGLVLDDFCCNRVYVHVDRNNVVNRPPMAG